MTPVDTLDADVRGMLLAFTLLQATDTALTAIDDARGEACREASRALAELDEAARARTLAAWQRQAKDALAGSLARLHPSWSAEALAGERAEIVAAVRAGCGASPPEVARDLARLALGHLLPLCEGEAGALGERLCALELDELVDELAHRGAQVIGQSLVGAAPTLRARAMAAAGEPWAQDIAAASLAEVTPAERETALRVANVAGFPTASVRERLAGVGLNAVKDALAREHPASLARVAGRLPTSLGRPLLGW